MDEFNVEQMSSTGKNSNKNCAAFPISEETGNLMIIVTSFYNMTFGKSYFC
jgi:hypothetical protein